MRTEILAGIVIICLAGTVAFTPHQLSSGTALIGAGQVPGVVINHSPAPSKTYLGSPSIENLCVLSGRSPKDCELGGKKRKGVV